MFRMLAFVCLIVFSLSAGAEFRAGAALRLITPDPLLPVSGGVGTPEPVKEKKGELSARALVLEQGGTRVAIVGVDNIGIPHVLLDKARAQIKGIPPENVLIGATHTHSAPDAYGFPDEQGNHHADLKYLDWMCTQIAEAVNEAVEKLQPASLRIAVGEPKGKIAFNAYAERLFDPRCMVLQAVDAQGTAISTLVNYAVHPEVLGPGVGILSPDLCGPMYDRIEAQGGGLAVFMNSAQGGMVTADNRKLDATGKAYEDDMRTWEECLRIGNLLADEALKIIAAAPLQADPALAIKTNRVTFPVDSPLLRQVTEHSPIMELEPGNKVSTTMACVTVGTAQMLTIPGEALPNIGAYLRRNMPTEHAFLLGLTNDAFGYILAKEDWSSFKVYDYVSRTSLGEQTAEILEREALALIAAAPKPAAGVTTKE
jgi:hypothetical protein